MRTTEGHIIQEVKAPGCSTRIYVTLAQGYVSKIKGQLLQEASFFTPKQAQGFVTKAYLK